MFEDGQIAGPDPDGYAFELLARRPAAEFIARQIRLADDEKRDVTPVLWPYLKSQALAVSDKRKEIRSYTTRDTSPNNICVPLGLVGVIDVRRY
jgi:hypothetical protein